jgi:hypothetical protein
LKIHNCSHLTVTSPQSILTTISVCTKPKFLMRQFLDIAAEAAPPTGEEEPPAAAAAAAAALSPSGKARGRGKKAG